MRTLEVSLSSGTTLRDAKLTYDLVQKAIRNLETTIQHIKHEAENPQVKLMLVKQQAQLETLLAVEASLLGNKVALNMMAT
jgi:hypothetical protein